MDTAALIEEAVENRWQLGVCAQIINEAGEILLIQRASNDWCAGVWEMPGGSVEHDEDLIASIAREVKEETSLDIIGIPEPVCHFDFFNEENGKTKRKFCFRVRTTGDIRLSLDHGAYRFMSLDDIQQLKVQSDDSDPYEIFYDHAQILLQYKPSAHDSFNSPQQIDGDDHR